MKRNLILSACVAALLAGLAAPALSFQRAEFQRQREERRRLRFEANDRTRDLPDPPPPRLRRELRVRLLEDQPVVRALPPPPRTPRVVAPPPAPQGPSGVVIPVASEQRLEPDHVIIQVSAGLTPAQLQALLQSNGLVLVESQRVALLNLTVHRARISNGRTPRQVLQALARDRRITRAQPNFIHSLPQPSLRAASLQSAGATGANGTLPQYAVAKLGLDEAHRLSRGERVKVALVDSGIDVAHPELSNVLEKSFDAGTGQALGPGSADSHGTGMASAIFAHAQLAGVAPEARLLAARSFGISAQPGGSAQQGTSWYVARGIDWSVGEGARVLNLSFAGPRDAMVSGILAAATQRGVIAVAAAGNAGPTSPPLFPGSDANVIAVTATDEGNRVFGMANRGRYIAVAAPGVDVLVAQPQSGYGLTTGTSVATAHVSGVVALMLARDPSLTLARARAILTGTALDLGQPGPDSDFGSGLVNTSAALARVPLSQAAR
ncbi:MAG: S8 family serine peptidase [Hyphomicrobiales bacterium]|nr:S8 family serine peptidase [Hyphomicrobiales bacterium]